MSDVWFPGDQPAVCIIHRRFVPCRWNDGCVFSEIPEDVADVEAYQAGECD